MAARSLCDSEDAGYVVACEDVRASSAGAAADCEREEERGSMVLSDGRKTSAIKKGARRNLFCRENGRRTWLVLKPLQLNGTISGAPSLWRNKMKDMDRREGEFRRSKVQIGGEKIDATFPEALGCQAASGY